MNDFIWHSRIEIIFLCRATMNHTPLIVSYYIINIVALILKHDNVYRNEIVYCELEKFVVSILSPNLVIYAIVSMMDFKCEILKKIN